MDLIFTSYNISNQKIGHSEAGDYFFRMPPVSMTTFNGVFVPDYEILLLADRLILDQQSIEELSKHKTGLYSEVASTLKILHSEGFIKTIDFESVLHAKKDLLSQMVENDLKDIEKWVPILNDSKSIWEKFYKLIADEKKGSAVSSPELVLSTIEMHEFVQVNDHIYYGSTDVRGKLKRFSLFFKVLFGNNFKSERVEESIRGYLNYVNSNIIISNELNCGFYDWSDIEPFYNQKFASIRGQEEVKDRVQSVKELFKVSFPQFGHWDSKSLIRALQDKRIVELKNLVDDAAKGKVEFDCEFADRTILEVFRINKDVKKYRKIISRATIPLKMIPIIGSPAQELINDIGIELYEDRKKEKFQWYYFISEYGSKD